MTTASRLLDPALPHERVLRIVRRRWREVQRGEFELCLGLRRLFRDNVHRGAGFSSFGDYAESKLDIPEKLAWTFSRIGEHLERLPALQAAMDRGDLSYTKAREFAAVADDGNVAYWIEYSRTHTNREVEREVVRYRRKAEGTAHAEATTLTSTMDGREEQAVRAARIKLARETRRAVPKDKVLPTLAKMFVDGAISNEGASKPPPPKPYLSIHLCPGCLDTWVPTPGRDMRVPLSAWLDELRRGTEPVSFLGDLLCGCEGPKHRRDSCPRARPRGEAPPSSRHIPEWVKRHVEARDGFRCRVPGCSCAGPYELSHLRGFAEGGAHVPENVAQHCSAHNAMIETGRIRVVGEAPVEHYYLADGTYLGVGYNPVPLSHVGRATERPGSARNTVPRPLVPA